MEYRDRVRLDRYAVKNPDAQPQINDMVVASLQRKFDRTGRPVESREIGWVQSVNPDGTYDVKLDTDGTTEPKIPRSRLDYVTEKTYPDICRRVATAISTVEKKKDRKKFAEAVETAMVAERFVPAGRILSGLGRPGYDLTLFNCYVFNITQDSRRGITEHWGRLFETYSRGGGVGTPLSVLRPKGTVVRKVNGRSSGSVSWAEQFSQITGAVEQGGCFALYSKIDTPEGPVAANELANKYNQGTTVYVSTHCGAKRITNVFRNGIKPTYRIGVRCGRDVHVTTVSDDHKIITNRQTDAPVETMPGWYFVDVANAAPGIDVAVLKNNDVVVGQITEVLYVGEQETVDFEVADVHILSSDGIYTSNSRRGAAMLCQWCWHPDVLELVDVKALREEILLPDGKTFSRNKNLLCNVNVSILLTEGFMRAVQQNADWDLVFPDTDAPGYDAQWNGDIWRWRDELKKPVVVYRTIKARDLWNRIIQRAWEAGEPGIIFMERANQMSNSWYYAPLVGSNPCAEEPLPDNAVCNLAHLNLGRYVTTATLPRTVQTTAQAKRAFDWETLKADVQMGVRFLDNVNDLNVYHDDAVKKQQLSERRIGLGILGYGDALMRLGLCYGSDDATAFTNELMRVFTTTAYKASVQLAKERGAFPRFQADHFLNSGFMKQMPKDVRALVRRHGIRNVTITTIAPTGSTSVLMNTSTGCEPFFDLQYTSTTRIGIVKEKSGVVDQIFQQFGTEPQKWPPYVVTAQRGITPEHHVKTQAAMQRWIDSAIAKTINLPANATVKDVADAYMLMWELGCKGGTVYRDGSRDVQVLYTDKPVPVQVVEASSEIDFVRPRPDAGISVTFSEESPIGTIHMTIRHDPQTGDPIDVFVVTGKGDASADAQALGRLMSMILRFPDDQKINQQRRMELIRNQLSDILGRGQVGLGPDAKRSMPDAIAKILTRYLEADFPVANLPFGLQQMKYLLDELRTCGGDTTKLDQISGFILEGDPGNGHDVDEYRAEMETEIQKAEQDGIKLPYDYCPGCGNCTLVIIPGKCPCCRTCGYTQC